MKMYLISDNTDTYTGMRLAGVEGVIVHERNELKDALEKTIADKEVGIILLTKSLDGNFLRSLMKYAFIIKHLLSLRFLTDMVPVANRILLLHMSMRQSA